MLILGLLLTLAAQTVPAGNLTPAEQQFQAGLVAYQAGDFSLAAESFRAAVGERPAAGVYQDLGDAEWQQGRVGPAIVAWEQALWLSPQNAAAENNLKYARTLGQIDAPELTWYEVISTWLPSGWWALLTAFSLWLVADLLARPGITRRRRTGWPAVAQPRTVAEALLAPGETAPARVAGRSRAASYDRRARRPAKQGPHYRALGHPFRRWLGSG